MFGAGYCSCALRMGAVKLDRDEEHLIQRFRLRNRRQRLNSGSKSALAASTKTFQSLARSSRFPTISSTPPIPMSAKINPPAPTTAIACQGVQSPHRTSPAVMSPKSSANRDAARDDFAEGAVMRLPVQSHCLQVEIEIVQLTLQHTAHRQASQPRHRPHRACARPSD